MKEIDADFVGQIEITSHCYLGILKKSWAFDLIINLLTVSGKQKNT